MIKTLLLFLFLIPVILFGQEDKDVQTIDVNKGSSYITFSVSPFLLFISPRWNFGYIKSVDEKIKLGVTVGIGASRIVFDNYNASFSNYFIWEIRPEVYIIHNPKSKVSIYNSVELFYINENAAVKNSYYITENDFNVYFKQADYNRQKVGAVVNFGVFVPFSSYFGMNFYAGLGIKWRQNTYTNVVQAEPYPNNYDDFLWRSYYRKEGLKIGFQPNFGVNLNFILQ